MSVLIPPNGFLLKLLRRSLFPHRGGFHMTPFEWITTLVSVTALVVQAIGVLKDKRQEK
jgi:hypothetical protein